MLNFARYDVPSKRYVVVSMLIGTLLGCPGGMNPHSPIGTLLGFAEAPVEYMGFNIHQDDLADTPIGTVSTGFRVDNIPSSNIIVADTDSPLSEQFIFNLSVARHVDSADMKVVINPEAGHYAELTLNDNNEGTGASVSPNSASRSYANSIIVNAQNGLLNCIGERCLIDVSGRIIAAPNPDYVQYLCTSNVTQGITVCPAFANTDLEWSRQNFDIGAQLNIQDQDIMHVFAIVTSELIDQTARFDSVYLIPGINYLSDRTELVVNKTPQNDVGAISEPPQVDIRVVIDNGNGGRAIEDDFVVEVVGFSSVNPTPGTYELSTIVQPNGYRLEQSTCGDTVTLVSGARVECIFSFDDIPPVVNITPLINNNNGGSAQSANFIPRLRDYTPDTPKAGSYQVELETSIIGYGIQSVFCNGTELPGTTIDVRVGDVLDCNVTLDDIAPILSLTSNIDILPVEAIGYDNNQPLIGTYTLNTELVDGYTLEKLSCSNGEDTGTVTLSLGDQVICDLVFADTMEVFYENFNNPSNFEGYSDHDSEIPELYENVQSLSSLLVEGYISLVRHDPVRDAVGFNTVCFGDGYCVDMEGKIGDDVIEANNGSVSTLTSSSSPLFAPGNYELHFQISGSLIGSGRFEPVDPLSNLPLATIGDDRVLVSVQPFFEKELLIPDDKPMSSMVIPFSVNSGITSGTIIFEHRLQLPLHPEEANFLGPILDEILIIRK